MGERLYNWRGLIVSRSTWRKLSAVRMAIAEALFGWMRGGGE